MIRDDSDHFVAKWLDAEPWHRLLLVFESPANRRARRLIEALGHELRGTALDSSDARVVAARLGWWMEEWQQLAAGTPRHPVTIALASIADQPIAAQAGAAWVDAATALAIDASDPTTPARIERWQRYTQAQAAASQSWLRASGGDAAVHAASLLVERIGMRQADLKAGRLPVPLDVLARHGLTRSQFVDDDAATARALADYAGDLALSLGRSSAASAGSYRRAQAALARLRARGIAPTAASAASGAARLPPLRSAFAAWRAFRKP